MNITADSTTNKTIKFTQYDKIWRKLRTKRSFQILE